MPTVTVMLGKERDENLTHLPTPRRAAPKNARQKMKSLRERRQPVQIKNAYYMALDTPMRSVNYSRNIPRSTPPSGQTKKMKPAPEAKNHGKSV